MIINQIVGGKSGGNLTLADVPLGTAVWINVNSYAYQTGTTEVAAPTELAPFIVAHKGLPSDLYDKSCDGVWLVGFHACRGGRWTSAGRYKDSDVDTTLNNYFYSKMAPQVRALIKEVKIPYFDGTYLTGSNGLARKIFPLNITELGQLTSANALTYGAKLDWFDAVTDASSSGGETIGKRAAGTYNGGLPYWNRAHTSGGAKCWCRPTRSSPTDYVADDGIIGYSSSDNYNDLRPAFVMPPDVEIDAYGNILGTNAAIGDFLVGSIVYCKVNGVRTAFRVVQQGKPSSALYDDSCNGTWLLMVPGYQKMQWNNSESEKYENSSIHSYLNGEFLNSLDIGRLIKQVKIPYLANGYGGTIASGANGLSTRVFLPSMYELDFTNPSSNVYYPVDGTQLAYFGGGGGRVAFINDATTSWWSRSPSLINRGLVWGVYTDGDSNSDAPTSTDFAVRPMFILPSNTMVDANGDIIVSSN